MLRVEMQSVSSDSRQGVGNHGVKRRLGFAGLSQGRTWDFAFIRILLLIMLLECGPVDSSKVGRASHPDPEDKIVDQAPDSLESLERCSQSEGSVVQDIPQTIRIGLIFLFHRDYRRNLEASPNRPKRILFADRRSVPRNRPR